MNLPLPRRPFVAALLLAAAALQSAVASWAQDNAPPMQVGIVEMMRQPVPSTVTLPGRAVAFEEVDLRPRVDGVIEEILYTPGQPLKVGDPLFRIDDAAYRAAVASDEADLATAEANLPVAQSAYDRAEKLEGSGYTEAEVETAKATLAEAQATLDAAQSALDYSRTQLSWTTIRSPIDGVADVSEVSVGDLVTAAQSDALTTITQLDPIYVDMIETSARLLSVRRMIDTGTLKMNDTLEASLVLETGQVYEGAGELISPGIAIAPTTGTFTVRFRFGNPDRLILPGMFVRGEVTLGTIDAFLVPQRAAELNDTGTLTAYVVGADGTAQPLSLTEIGTYQANWIVTEGIEPGAQLIVDGLKSLRAGQPVVPVPAAIDANGLVQEKTSDAGEGD